MVKGEAEKKRKVSASALLLAMLLLAAGMMSACSGAGSDNISVAPQAAPADKAGSMEALPAGGVALTPESSSAQAVDPAAPAADRASSAAGSSGGIGPIAGSETVLNRKVIYKAHVTMGVADYDKAETQLRDAIHLSGAYILQFSNSVDGRGRAATYVIKVPADGFSSFMGRLREIEKDLQMQMEGSDVTEEYVDLEARLDAKKAAEARLLAFMDKASSTDDLVRFSSELAAVQEQIEQIKGRMRYIDQNVAYSTVNVRLYENKEGEAVLEKESGLGDRLTDALTGSAKALGQFGQALLIFLAALLPVAAVMALIGIPVYIFVRNKQRARRELSAERRKQWNSGLAAGASAVQPAQEPPADSAPAHPEDADSNSEKP